MWKKKGDSFNWTWLEKFEIYTILNLVCPTNKTFICRIYIGWDRNITELQQAVSPLMMALPATFPRSVSKHRPSVCRVWPYWTNSYRKPNYLKEPNHGRSLPSPSPSLSSAAAMANRFHSVSRCVKLLFNFISAIFTMKGGDLKPLCRQCNHSCKFVLDLSSPSANLHYENIHRVLCILPCGVLSKVGWDCP